MNENKHIKLRFLFFVVLLVVIIVFFCVCSLLTSLGYKQAGKAYYTKQVDTDRTDILSIVIDPGHGGEDPGAVNGDCLEKVLNLDIALKLNDFFKISDYNIILTRKDDRLLYYEGQSERKKFYDLRNRKSIAEANPYSIYIGIHMNKFPIAKYHGLQTFYSKNNNESKRLAGLIQDVTRMIDTKNERKIKQADDSIYILDNLEIPAVLIECGFISNENDAKMLSDGSYQKRLAFLIFCTVEQWNGDAK